MFSAFQPCSLPWVCDIREFCQFCVSILDICVQTLWKFMFSLQFKPLVFLCPFTLPITSCIFPVRPEVSALCGHFACQAYRRLFDSQCFSPNRSWHLEVWVLNSVDICWYITFAPSRFGKSTPGAYALTYLTRYDNWDDCHHVRLKIWCVHSSSLPFRTSYYDVLTVETYKSPRVLLRKLAKNASGMLEQVAHGKTGVPNLPLQGRGCLFRLAQTIVKNLCPFEAGRCEDKT